LAKNLKPHCQKTCGKNNSEKKITLKLAHSPVKKSTPLFRRVVALQANRETKSTPQNVRDPSVKNVRDPSVRMERRVQSECDHKQL
jgi:hypothetical protein